jgi:UDP-N-acetylglucosamine 4-epimerase
VEGSVASREDCAEATRGVDVVLHQAALGSVPRSIEEPLETNAANLTGT